MFAILTLSFGYKKPETADKGSPVFEALEDNIDQLNAHTHDGVTSDNISTFNMTRGTVAVPSTGWSADGNLFKQTVTFPTGYSVANGSEYTKASIRFYYSSGAFDKNELFPKTVYLTDTTFELHSTSSSQAYTVTFV